MAEFPPAATRQAASARGNPAAPWRWGQVFPLPLLLLLIVACGGDPPGAEVLQRQGRFGILRDLVLFDRPEELGGPFFMDRFETTWGDWADYLRDQETDVEPRWESLWGGPVPSTLRRSQPMARVSLHEARRFARWRFGRLPRLDEWQYAATNAGRYEYPWGTQPRPAWANTADLGLLEPTAVGTFESGRRGEGPYDLVGNLAEWTETPMPQWFEDRFLSAEDLRETPLLDFHNGVRRVGETPGLGGMFLRPAPYPAYWILTVGFKGIPRVVAGWSFSQALALDEDASPRQWGRLPEWQRPPEEWSDSVGLRLVADPETLVRGLLEFLGPLPEGAEPYLRRFFDRPDHRRVFAEAWARLPADIPRGVLDAWLEAEIGP